MASDPAVAESSGSGNSGASCRCLASPEIGTGLSFRLNSHSTSVRVPTYIGADDGGPLPNQVWDAPDQGVEGEEDPDSV
jgi:hypothetical protein